MREHPDRRDRIAALGTAGRERLPVPTYPADLPITARREELLERIRDHQVVVVAGETGSGKSTQIPKLCLELGRGLTGLIGHTQPRRVAARAVAERVAEELGTELGDAVGYTVRFTDRVSDGTYVKVMTDGILLAEIQRDRTLARYDTLILDEAHERSLNVDFLIGYLRRLLPQRPDLKLIITSATIDTARFAAHFDDAPVVEVSGRSYPVEVRYRPFGGEAAPAPEEGDDVIDDDRNLLDAVGDAVAELAREGPGDVLVFLSGEREIRDCADALAERNWRDTEILPLYGRLSAAEQHRVFQSHRGRRVVLATNVAETSITVPGVRYVVDGGTARVSRYSHRLKVQRLPIEKVSRASANQRAGRCGRVAPGICIRLYAEDDHDARPEFTDPEILRTNLASVVLQMANLGLGDVAGFGFVDPPDPRAVRDGIALLEELGALDPSVEPGRRGYLTPLGRRLVRLPIDPRLGRMVLEAERHGCVREVLVIAAALSIQDVRERPLDQKQAADEMHRRFAVPGSDLLGLVKLWDHLEERRRAVSSSRFRRECRAEFLNHLRVREWRDLYRQLARAAEAVGVVAGREEAAPDRVHRAVLAGLLSQIGMRDRDTREFRGARGARFQLASASVLARKPPAWVMAAELVETNRLWARGVAAIEPRWCEDLAGPLLKHSYTDVRWEERSGRAVCTEKATLYGLPVVPARTIGLDRVDPEMARELFVDHALVRREWETRHDFLAVNEEFLDDARALGDKLRRADLFDHDTTLRTFYDARLGDDVVSGRHFDRWWKTARRERPDRLTLGWDDLVGVAGLDHDPDDLPDEWRQGSMHLPVTYRFDPDDEHDGVTVHVPLALLDQVEPWDFDWHVPGYRAELVATLIGALPKDTRRSLSPLADTIDAVVASLRVDGRVGVDGAGDGAGDAGPTEGRGRTGGEGGDGRDGRDGSTGGEHTSASAWAPVQERPLVEVIAEVLSKRAGQPIGPDEFEIQALPPWLRITFAVDDADGTAIAFGKDLDAVRRLVGPRVRRAVADLFPDVVRWSGGDLPRRVTAPLADGNIAVGFPALLDRDGAVRATVFSRPEVADRVMAGGLRRLVLTSVPVGVRALERSITPEVRAALLAEPEITLGALLRDVVEAAAGAVIDSHGGLTWSGEGMDDLVVAARDELRPASVSALTRAGGILVAAGEARSLLDRLAAPSLEPAVDDARTHLARLVRPGFVASAGTARLDDVGRYVKGIVARLRKLPEAPDRDAVRRVQVVAIERSYRDLLAALEPAQVTARVVDAGWLIEELRVGLFAQQLGTRVPVSPSRVEAELSALWAGDLWPP